VNMATQPMSNSEWDEIWSLVQTVQGSDSVFRASAIPCAMMFGSRPAPFYAACNLAFLVFTKEYRQAVEFANKSIVEGPEHSALLLLRAEALRRMTPSLTDEALTAIKLAAEAEERKATAHRQEHLLLISIEHGNILLTMNLPNEARSVFERALAENPQSTAAEDGLARARRLAVTLERKGIATEIGTDVVRTVLKDVAAKATSRLLGLEDKGVSGSNQKTEDNGDLRSRRDVRDTPRAVTAGSQTDHVHRKLEDFLFALRRYERSLEYQAEALRYYAKTRPGAHDGSGLSFADVPKVPALEAGMKLEILQELQEYHQQLRGYASDLHNYAGALDRWADGDYVHLSPPSPPRPYRMSKRSRWALP
jgi:tetratricopeptide (TPR) repeat protein